MRLFFGVTVSEAVRAAAALLIGGLRGTGADFRWSKPAGLHLTLRFLGETPPERLPALEETLRQAAARPAFDVTYGALGAFDSVEDPKTVWIGLAGGAQALGALAAACGPQDRPFFPHLTLGRRRSRGKLEELKAALKTAPPLGLPQRVDRLILFESRPSESGSLYVPLKETPLAP